MEQKKYKFEVTNEEINEFISEWLNSDHTDYAKYVKGIKLFKEYLEEKNNKPN